MSRKSTRKEQILQSLAHMLETHPGNRITTAALAASLSVSEAALYRHFPSKARMFEGLISFIEETIFTRVHRISQNEYSSLQRIEKNLTLLLAFAEKNPGISRLLSGDALTGETERLRLRIAQFYDRIEVEIKKIIREAELREGLKSNGDSAMLAKLLLAVVDGKIVMFVRSNFKAKPTEGWVEQWPLLATNLFKRIPR